MMPLFKTLNVTAVIMVIWTLAASPSLAQKEAIDWLAFEEAIQLAEESQKPVLVDVWAPWCGWCKKMQKEVYPKHAGSLTSSFILTRLNRDDQDSRLIFNNRKLTPLRLAQQLNVQDVPAIVFLSPKGEYLLHISGFIKPENLGPILEYVSSESYKSKSFNQFISNRFR